jgi:hypothetical protein
VIRLPGSRGPEWLGRVLINAQMSGLDGLCGNVLLGQSITGFDPDRT